MRKKTLVALLSAIMAMCLAVVAFAACGGGNPTVTISQTSASIIVGETVELTATASDESKIEWSSSDASVASVSKGGVVTGRKEGTATITAKAGEATATCEVTVSKIDVTISQTTASIERGQTLTLTATAADNGAITWVSSDESVATVENGVVTAIKEGTATITAKRGAAGSASCEVTVVWDSKPADYYVISAGVEGDATANPGKFIYWDCKAEYNLGADVAVSQAEYANGKATFAYTGGSNACWFGFQIFYKNAANQVGKNYKFTCTIESAVAGDITINGTVVSLVEGTNNVEIFYNEAANNANNVTAASVSIQCGTSAGTAIAENTMSISNMSFSEYTPEKLSAPTSVSISDKVATVSEVANADAYTLLFCQGDAIKYQVTLQSGETIDDSTMEDGIYDIKAVAIGSGMYQSSDASQVLTTYTVANGGVSYDLFAGGATDAVANAGKYYYWTEFAGITNATYDNGTISFEVVNGGNWYSNQIFYENSALTAGSQYTLTLKINSSVAGNITVNGTVIALAVGNNDVSVVYAESGAGDGPSLSIQIGTYAEGSSIITAGVFVLTDINWAIVEGGTTPTPDPEPEVPSDIVYGEAVDVAISEVINGGEDAAVANAGKLLEWHDQNWCGSTVTLTSSFADGAATLEWTSTGFCWFGVQLFYKDTTHVTGRHYKLTLKINSSVAGNITVNGKVVSLVAGDNDIEVEFVEKAASTISIQMGVESANTMISAATMVISDIAIAAEETQAAASVFDAAGVYGNDSVWASLT